MAVYIKFDDFKTEKYHVRIAVFTEDVNKYDEILKRIEDIFGVAFISYKNKYFRKSYSVKYEMIMLSNNDTDSYDNDSVRGRRYDICFIDRFYCSDRFVQYNIIPCLINHNNMSNITMEYINKIKYEFETSRNYIYIE